jgi:hypothetical protein
MIFFFTVLSAFCCLFGYFMVGTFLSMRQHRLEYPQASRRDDHLWSGNAHALFWAWPVAWIVFRVIDIAWNPPSKVELPKAKVVK